MSAEREPVSEEEAELEETLAEVAESDQKDLATLEAGAEFVGIAPVVDDDDDATEVVDVSADAAKTLRCTYATDETTHVTTLVIEGRYETTITQSDDPKTGKPIFTSPDFKAPQPDFKSALEWVGRNVGTRTIRAEYDRQTTPLGSTRGNAKTAKLEAEIREANARAARFEQIATDAQRTAEQVAEQTAMALEAIMKRLGMDDPAPDATDDSTQDSPSTSESSEKDQTESSAGTQKPKSKGRS